MININHLGYLNNLRDSMLMMTSAANIDYDKADTPM
jgi:hypothetical protein